MSEKMFFLRRRLPTQKTWQREMTRQRGSTEARVFMSRLRAKYDELFTRSQPYRPRVLQKLHFEKNILPVIAAYLVMMQEGQTPAAALSTVDALLDASVAGQKRLYKFWGRFPFFFDMLRWMLKPLMRLQYPAEGWQLDFPHLGPDVVALDSHHCFYLDVLTEYGLPELTSHFCRLDDELYEGVTPYIRFERTQTLGRGGEFCDFRYYRVRPNRG